MRGFLVPPSGAMVTIARAPQEATCPQAFDGLAIRSRVPHGTVHCLVQDVERGIVVPIQDDATPRTDVCPHGERLLDERPTGRTLLAGELRCYCHHSNGMSGSIVVHPPEELSPSGIVDAFGEV